MTENKVLYLALDYLDRRYSEDRQLAVTNTTREVFTGSNKILAPYLDPIKYRRLEMLYDARLMLMFYFFEVLLDQAVYNIKTSGIRFKIVLHSQVLWNLGKSNLPPEQLLRGHRRAQSSLCGRLEHFQFILSTMFPSLSPSFIREC